MTSRRSVPSDVSTSSMADVTFLLLVYFLLALTLTSHRGLDFRLPREEPGRVEPIESVLATVRADGTLIVDGRPMAVGELLEYLRPKLQRDPSKPVIVRGEPGAAYGDVVEVLDTLRLGRERLGLAEDVVIAIPSSREAAQMGW